MMTSRSNDDLARVDSVLEFTPCGERVDYTAVTEGLTLEERPRRSHAEVLAARRADMEFLMMDMDTGRQAYVARRHDVWDDGTPMEVPLGKLLTEPEATWQRRLGEIQLRRQLAETPEGFVFEFYPPGRVNVR
jgi:hypothetical protein